MLDKNKGDYLRNLGFDKGWKEELKWNETKTIKEWIAKGAELEDEGSDWDAIIGRARYVNHFHNPTRLWNVAGLSDLQNGESSLGWAQDSTKQDNSIGGDWSWQTIRQLYYVALTGRAFDGTIKAINEQERNEYFAQTFKGLGHQMHLIQDAAQPAHVRNDAHHEVEFNNINKG